MIYNWFWCFISLITKVINRFLQFFYLYWNEYTKSILFYEIKLFQLYYVLHLLRITFLNIFSYVLFIFLFLFSFNVIFEIDDIFFIFQEIEDSCQVQHISTYFDLLNCRIFSAWFAIIAIRFLIRNSIIEIMMRRVIVLSIL